MNKQKKNSRNLFLDHYVFFSVLTSLAALVVLYFFVVSQAYVEFREVSRLDVAEEQARLESLKSDLALLRRLESSFKNINQATIVDIESAVPNEAELPNLFVNLDGIAKASGNQITSVTINKNLQREKIGLGRVFGEPDDVIDPAGQVVTSSLYPFTKLHVLRAEIEVVSSSYTDFKKFIETVESNLRVMDISDFSYNPRESSFRMELETYYIGAGVEE